MATIRFQTDDNRLTIADAFSDIEDRVTHLDKQIDIINRSVRKYKWKKSQKKRESKDENYRIRFRVQRL